MATESAQRQLDTTAEQPEENDISSEPNDDPTQRISFDNKPAVVQKGLKVQQRDKHAPQLSFSYALTPFVDKFISLDWTVIISEEVVCQHVRCYELQEGDDIPKLITNFREELAVAVVLVNTDDSYVLQNVCSISKQVSYPIIVVNRKEGLKLLKMVEDHSESLNLLARIDVEDTTDVNQVTIVADKHSGVVTELKAEIKRFMFTDPDKRPKPLSSNGPTIMMVMSAFDNFEKKARGNHQLDIQKILKSISKHISGVFADDFPFHMLLIYRILTIKDIYHACDETKKLISMFLDKIEQLSVEHLAEVFINFLARGDFDVMYAAAPRKIFYLLTNACKMFLERRSLKKQSTHDPRYLTPEFIYSSIMWTSLNLKLHDQRGLKATQATRNIWYNNLICHAEDINLEPETLKELCRGLNLQKLLLLPSQSTLSLVYLTDLFVVKASSLRPIKQIKEYVCATKPFLTSADTLALIFTIRSVYLHIPVFEHHKLMMLCSTGKKMDLLIEGIDLADSIYTTLIHNLERQCVQKECLEWLQLFIMLINFTDSAAVDQLHLFILKNYEVLRDIFCKKNVKKYICDTTKKALEGKNIIEFFPLFNENYSMLIYPIEAIEDICERCIIPANTTLEDTAWSKFFTEVTSRFGSDKSHSFLLDLFERLSMCYATSSRHKQFLIDILRLQAPKLFSCEGHGVLHHEELKEEDTVIPAKHFTSLLRIFIQKHGLRQSVLNDMELIFDCISEEDNAFQKCVLDVLLQEFVPEQKDLLECSSKPLKFALMSLSGYISWPVVMSRKQSFCWSVVNKYYQKIPIDSDGLSWIHEYVDIICEICCIFQKCKKIYESTTKSKMDIDNVVSDLSAKVSGMLFQSIKRYFLWIKKCQLCMKKWQYRLRQSDIRYSDFLHFVTYSGTGEIERMCGSLDIKNVVDHKCIDYVGGQFQKFNKALQNCLIKTLPTEFGSQSCTLHDVLKQYSFNFPSALQSQLEEYVTITQRPTTLSSDKHGDVTQRMQYILICWPKISLNILCKLVNDLDEFLSPFKHYLDKLVFFKLFPSNLFHQHFRIEMKRNVTETTKSSDIGFKFSDLTTPVTSSDKQLQIKSMKLEEHSVESFVKCLERVFSLFSRLLTGQATYVEIVANGEIVFDDLDIDQECNVLTMYSNLLQTSCSGLDGVRSFVELSQYAVLIPLVENVCRHFDLLSCLHDPALKSLLQIVDKYESTEGRHNLTPIEALTMVKQIKEVVLIQPQLCYELFNVMSCSKPFYVFLKEGQFVDEAGKTSFQEHHQLITAQLQHEEYDEVVLNHLLGAFKVISPFLGNLEGLKNLMSQLFAFDNIMNGLKQLQTVNTNIMIIRLWFARAKGDTFENIANDLDCVVKTGTYIFTTTHETLNYTMLLHYNIPSQPHTSQNQKLPSEVEIEKWNIDQIGEFVRKLGFLDRDKGGGDQLKCFLKINEIAYKLLDLYRRLRELGHYHYIEDCALQLPCSISPCEALERVDELQSSLQSWAEEVAALRNQYKWLLFFNVPKLLRLYKTLKCLWNEDEEEKIVNQISCEVAFLCTNSKEMRTKIVADIKKVNKHHKDDERAPVEIVGSFLHELFLDHSLHQVSLQGHMHSHRQILHCCHHFSLSELIQQIIGIYHPDIPKVFQIFRCQKITTEEELKLLFERAKNFPLKYVVFDVNKLSYKLQEQLIELYLQFQQTVKNQLANEDEVNKKIAEIHFIETVPSMMREMPWIQIKEQENAILSIEEAKMTVSKNVMSSGSVDVKLVYGLAGNGKTHYIMSQLMSNSIIIAVNENFSPLYAINVLSHLNTVENCGIFFNFTLQLPMNDQEKSRYKLLFETVGWFFFDLLLLGYVEDTVTGKSFYLPRGLSWSIFIEVPSLELCQSPDESLKVFTNTFPVFHLLGVKDPVTSEYPYIVDEEVQLVCKYLKALKNKRIDNLYSEGGPKVKFSNDKKLNDSVCRKLLQDNNIMPEYVKKTKLTQRLFIKYMKRRCSFLDTLPAFNYNTGHANYTRTKDGYTLHDTHQLGSTLMNAMIDEVKEFCDYRSKQGFSFKPCQQIIYDYAYGGSSFGLLMVHPEKLSSEDKLKFENIGVEVPDMMKIRSCEVLCSILSRALDVKLKDNRLSALDDLGYVLTLDYVIKMLSINERYHCGVPVIIEGETGVGKTALLEMLSILWNQSHLSEWNKKINEIFFFFNDKLNAIRVHTYPKYEEAMQVLEDIQSCINKVTPEALKHLLQIPSVASQSDTHTIVLRKYLLPLKTDPILVLLTCDLQNNMPLKELFQKAEQEFSIETTAMLLFGIFKAEMKPMFHKLNVHSGLSPNDVEDFFQPVFDQAKALRTLLHEKQSSLLTHVSLPFVTVFLDEVNTSSYLGLFKEIIVDKSLNGKPIPETVFIVGACNPHRGDSLAMHAKDNWVRGSYYVSELHPTLKFLAWDYGALNELQEKDYIIAKMSNLNQSCLSEPEVKNLADLIAVSQTAIRQYAKEHYSIMAHDSENASLERESSCCVSQRDIQRVFNFYHWLMQFYNKTKPEREPTEYRKRAVNVALGVVYYMRLNKTYREKYSKLLDSKCGRTTVKFTIAFQEELDWFIKQIELPKGIARTQALKENIFASIICTVTRTPLIIIGAPGSSKTLSFNQTIANLMGPQSNKELFRYTAIFPLLDPHCYQCSRRTTSSEIQTVFSRAINRQRSNRKFNEPVNCVVFMDEAGLPKESSQALKVLHSHLDKQEVSFVAISNNILDAAKTNRAVSLFRPETSDEDLETLAKGCLCSDLESPPAKLTQDLHTVVKFCSPYSDLVHKGDEAIRKLFGLRDFIHFINYLRHKRDEGHGITPQIVMHGLERNFNGCEPKIFAEICETFLKAINSSLNEVQVRGILEILVDSLRDCPQSKENHAENGMRYKLIIDASEDGSLLTLLFDFDVLERQTTRTYTCSDFPGDKELQKINTIAAIRHSAVEGHTIILNQTDDIHESFYDLFNQRFRQIDDPENGPCYYTNISIGAHVKPSRVDPAFQCIVVIKTSELSNTPAPFLDRFEKYLVTHQTLLETALSMVPPCMAILVRATKEKVENFVQCISGRDSLFGFQSETVDSLILTLLPSSNFHVPEGIKVPESTTAEADLKLYLTECLLKVLRLTGFFIPLVSDDEHSHDVKELFSFIAQEPLLEGEIKCLDRLAIVQSIQYVMDILMTAPPPDEKEKIFDITPNLCLVLTLLYQWLVRYCCKKLMQLMTPEALILHHQRIPFSYIKNYLSYQSHFCLKGLIENHYSLLKRTEWSTSNSHYCPNKVLCFTRSSSQLHLIPAQFPSAVSDEQKEQLRSLVHDNLNELLVCKLSRVFSQGAVQEMLKDFVNSTDKKVCLFLVNIQKVSKKSVNHLRNLIDETENLNSTHVKLYFVLLHFPPEQFFHPCYPSLFLKSWNYYYIDTVAHRAVGGVVDIRYWFWQCCIPLSLPPKEISECFSLPRALYDILPQAIPILSSRIFIRESEAESSSATLSGSKCTELLKQMLFDRDVGIGQILCQRFSTYWKPTVMTVYLIKAASFTKNRGSTLNITDTLQAMLKTSFNNFLIYMITEISKGFNATVLFNKTTKVGIKLLFVDILKVFPLPPLSQISGLLVDPPVPCCDQQFPFFKFVYDSMEEIVRESYSDVNNEFDLLPEGIDGSTESSHKQHDKETFHFHLQTAITTRIEALIQASEKTAVTVVIDGMRRNPYLWYTYFTDFVLLKLQLESSEGIGLKLLEVYFPSADLEDPMKMFVLLHSFFDIHNLSLAKLATIMRPLDKVQQLFATISCEQDILSPKSFSSCLISLVKEQKKHPLGNPKELAVFVINSLFRTLVSTSEISYSSENLQVWFNVYRDVIQLKSLRHHIFEVCDSAGGNDELEAKVNLMHTTFLIFACKSGCQDSIVESAKQIFLTLYGSCFDANEKLITTCPRATQIYDVVLDTISHVTDCSNFAERSLMEGFFAFFFSDERHSCNRDDVSWFFNFVNGNLSNASAVIAQSHSEIMSSSILKYYLARILGVGTGSGPLNLYQSEYRRQIGHILKVKARKDRNWFYIPTFYDSESSGHKESVDMPLAHLYFTTVVEHLSSEQFKLEDLLICVDELNQQLEECDLEEKILMLIEVQAVLQTIAQQIPKYLNGDRANITEFHPLKGTVCKTFREAANYDEADRSHSLIVAMHMFKSMGIRRFTSFVHNYYDTLLKDIDFLKPLRTELTQIRTTEFRPYFFSFMDPAADSDLSALYKQIFKAMTGITKKGSMKSLKRIARNCCAGTVRNTSKSFWFRMMVWLVSYYEFFEKKTRSEVLCEFMGAELAEYLGEDCCVKLIQQVINPSFQPYSSRPQEQGFVDQLYEFFDKSKDQSESDLRCCVANTVAVILGSPPQSNHLWYHLFDPEKLQDTYITGFMCDSRVGPQHTFYNDGIKLTSDGMFTCKAFKEHACRGTYTLHSLYFLLWVNFGVFCIALLMWPDSVKKLSGTIFSNNICVRKHCLAQIKDLWRHMRNNLCLSDEELSFLSTSLLEKFHEIVSLPESVTAIDTVFSSKSIKGIFETKEELDEYEKIWHYCIFIPSWRSLNQRFAEYSRSWESPFMTELRLLHMKYLQYPSEKDLIHCIASIGDPMLFVNNGSLKFLSHFVMELPKLQAGGFLLPLLIEFYQWIHSSLGYLITHERAGTLSVHRVVEIIASKKYTKETGNWLRTLFNKLKLQFNQYIDIAGITSTSTRNAVRDKIKDDTPLLYFLTDYDLATNHDWLYTTIEEIILDHNAVIQMLYDIVHSQNLIHLARLLPEKPSTILPTEVDSSTCLVSEFSSLHGINDFLQLVRGHLPEIGDAHCSQMLFPMLERLEENIVNTFIAGKPIIDSPKQLRSPFKFRHVKNVSASVQAEMVHFTLNLEDMEQKFTEDLKVPLPTDLRKEIEFEFHTADYHTLNEVYTGLKVTAGFIIKEVINGNGYMESLKNLTLSNFMHTVYDNINDESHALMEIGIDDKRLAPTQITCLTQLQLQCVFSSLRLFDEWIHDGLYDYHTLPFSVKKHMSSSDKQFIEQCFNQWIVSAEDYLPHVQELTRALKDAESDIIKKVDESNSHISIVTFLTEIYNMSDENPLVRLIPTSIVLEHYVSLQLCLRRLKIMLQETTKPQHIHAEERWPQVVNALWKHLPHFKVESYRHDMLMVSLPGQYGFPKEELEPNSEEELLMNDTEKVSEIGKEGSDSDQDELSEESKLEKKASKYKSKNISDFLVNIKLNQYIDQFQTMDVDGAMLLDFEAEDLTELGVQSDHDKVKIVALFQRKLKGGVMRYPASLLMDILKESNLEIYRQQFLANDIDGDMLFVAVKLKVAKHMLREIGVGGVHASKIITTFKSKYLNE